MGATWAAALGYTRNSSDNSMPFPPSGVVLAESIPALILRRIVALSTWAKRAACATERMGIMVHWVVYAHGQGGRCCMPQSVARVWSAAGSAVAVRALNTAVPVLLWFTFLVIWFFRC